MLTLFVIFSLVLAGCSGNDGDITKYNLNITREGEGTVELDPDRATYAEGTPVEVTAIADSGWTFSHWEGSGFEGTTQKTITVTMDDDYNLKAVFTEDKPYTVSGRVLDINGNRLKGVKINFNGGYEPVLTGENGEWVKTGLKGEVNVFLESEGLPSSVTVTGESENLEFIRCNVPEAKINTENLETILTNLTSEEYGGRLPGTEGNRLATEYIVNYFQENSLNSPPGQPDYKQEYNQRVSYANEFPVLQTRNEDGEVIASYDYLEDFIELKNFWRGLKLKGSISAPILFYEDPATEIDMNKVSGKVMMVSWEVKEQSEELKDKIMTAAENGLAGAIVEVPVDYRLSAAAIPPEDVDNENGPIVFHVTSSVYKEIKQVCQEGNKVHMKVNDSVEMVEASNVIGYIPGTGDENLVIGAHFDHLGRVEDTYFPGALDNASGTAAMMEIARLLRENYGQPEKNIIFIGFNGEEEGLYGSHHYVNHPIFPLADTTLINFDMIGSSRDITPCVCTSGGENNIQDELRRLAAGYNMNLEEREIVRADHTPFAEKNCPAVLLIYPDESANHTQEDTMETVDVNKMEKMLKVILTYIINRAYNTNLSFSTSLSDYLIAA